MDSFRSTEEDFVRGLTIDAILEELTRAVEQLLGRASGPLRLRLVMMPTVVTILAIRAGLKDAREGNPAFLWAIIANPDRRRQRFLSVCKDVARIFVVALVLDTAYQLIVLRAFYVLQTLIVAVACAIVPYVMFRGPVTRVASGMYPKQADSTEPPKAKEGRRAEDQDRIDAG